MGVSQALRKVARSLQVETSVRQYVGQASGSAPCVCVLVSSVTTVWTLKVGCICYMTLSADCLVKVGDSIRRVMTLILNIFLLNRARPTQIILAG